MPTSIEIRPGEGGADAYAFHLELAEALQAHLRRLGATTSRSHDDGRTTVLTTTAREAQVAWLAGTHRVQRVSRGASARHTSTATIAVLGERTPPQPGPTFTGVRVDRYRGHGPGGQRKNKVATAIRLTHPSGIVVTRESGRSQADNLADAQRDLARRLADRMARANDAAIQGRRRAQVFTDRSAKTFTHNQQRGEVTDHSTGKRWSSREWAKGRIA